jgi:hypothetical protein
VQLRHGGMLSAAASSVHRAGATDLASGWRVQLHAEPSARFATSLLRPSNRQGLGARVAGRDA